MIDHFPSHPAKVEPSADMREMARAQHEWFVALVDTGFSETQALTMLGTAIGVAIANSRTSSEG